jgi:hypothetical protein
MIEKVKIKWLSHLKTKEEKEKLKRIILSVPDLWDRFEDICKEMKRTNQVPDYDSPSWAYKQADMNGFNRALDEIMSLVPDRGEDNE